MKLGKTSHALPYKLEYLGQRISGKHAVQNFGGNINNKLVKILHDTNNHHKPQYKDEQEQYEDIMTDSRKCQQLSPREYDLINEKGMLVNEKYIKNSQSNVGVIQKNLSSPAKFKRDTSGEDNVIEGGYAILQGGSLMNTHDRIDTAESVSRANRSSSNIKGRRSGNSLRKSTNSSRKKFQELTNSNSVIAGRIFSEKENDLVINYQKASSRKIPQKKYMTDKQSSVRGSSNSINKKPRQNSHKTFEAQDAYDDFNMAYIDKNGRQNSPKNYLTPQRNPHEKPQNLIEVRAKISKTEMKQLVKVLNSVHGIKDVEFYDNASSNYLKNFGSDTISAHITAQNKEISNLGLRSKYRNKISEQLYKELNDINVIDKRKKIINQNLKDKFITISENQGNSLMERERRGMLNQEFSTSRQRMM